MHTTLLKKAVRKRIAFLFSTLDFVNINEKSYLYGQKAEMKTYNKFMLALWLGVTVILIVFITYKVFTEGFERWGFMYIFAIIAFISFLLRRFMARRVEKQMKKMEEHPNNAKR